MKKPEQDGGMFIFDRRHQVQGEPPREADVEDELAAWPGRQTLTTRLAHQRVADPAGSPHDAAHGPLADAASDLGQPLPAGLRKKLEHALGADLATVRLHTGSASAAAAAAIQARAYTIGQDVHFGAGRFNPRTSAGQALIAHEVAHTVQQRGAAEAGPGHGRRQERLELSAPGDAHEVEAERFADSFLDRSPSTRERSSRFSGWELEGRDTTMSGGAARVSRVGMGSVARAVIHRDAADGAIPIANSVEPAAPHSDDVLAHARAAGVVKEKEPPRAGGAAAAGAAAAQGANPKGDPGALPGKLVEKYKKEADLSDVVVYRNSPLAVQKRTRGFATRDEIYLAPGVDETAVLAHEAAHVVQFRKAQGGAPQQNRAENERRAEAAAAGGQLDLGGAAPSETRFLDPPEGGTEAPAAANDKPSKPGKLWGLLDLVDVRGDLPRTQVFKENYQPKPPSFSWFVPIFGWPIGPGLTASAALAFSFDCHLSFTGSYEWLKDPSGNGPGTFNVTGNLSFGLGIGIGANLKAGVGIDILVANAGVGLAAAATLTGLLATQKEENVTAVIDPTGAKASDITISPQVTAEVKGSANVALAAWVDSLFGGHSWFWPFLNVAGSFDNFVFKPKIKAGSGGISMTMDKYEPGKFNWGSGKVDGTQGRATRKN